MPRIKGNLRIAHKVAKRVRRDIEFFQSPSFTMYYNRMKNFHRDRVLQDQFAAELAAKRAEESKREPLMFDQRYVDPSEGILPQGNCSVAKGDPFIIVKDSYTDDEGDPRPVRLRVVKNEILHEFLDSVQFIYCILIRLENKSKGSSESWNLYYGFDTMDPTPRVLGYQRPDARMDWIEGPEIPGLPRLGSSLVEVMDWVGQDENFVRTIYRPMPGAGHLPPWERMTPEQQEQVISYDPWKSELTSLQRFAIRGEADFSENRKNFFREFVDDHWT